MSHSLDNLITDMYHVAGVVDARPSIEVLTRYGANVARHADETLAAQTSRQSRKPGVIRASELGTPCNRQLWYNVHAPEKAEPITGKLGFKFLYGDLVEETVLLLAEAAGYTVTDRQLEVSYKVNDDWTIVGHMDAVIDGVVVDVKSASDYAFDEVRRTNYTLMPENDKFGYRAQLWFYDFQYNGIEDPKFIYVNKQSGDMALVDPGVDPLYNNLIGTINNAVAALSKPLKGLSRRVSVPHNKSGNMKLDVQCSYCAFKKECWGDKIRGFAYASGPVWLVEPIVKMPDVPEIK